MWVVIYYSFFTLRGEVEGREKFLGEVSEGRTQEAGPWDGVWGSI